ncbi:BnaA09g13760D [Brassica napus]|uniref:BnaA09g13760D protein n=1 Tax=Brassica napus TaxID=3708 RepID=A0A078FL41_BRANA|nr:BnaA09g13760D [Brassica napus]
MVELDARFNRPVTTSGCDF